MSNHAKQYSLSELCAHMADALEMTMPDLYWVRAEVSSLSERGGHCYLELVEKSKQGGVFEAKIRAICWANTYQLLKNYFYEQTDQPLQVGLQVLVQVSISLHPVYGLSLLIHNIDPSFTLGDLAQQRQATLRRLQEEGVMDMNKALPLPTLVKRVAVISSADAAGYGDFCNQLQNNPYGFPFQITLFSALMQGDRAAQSIIEALNRIYEQADLFDLVLILRGGGATTDLACFDNYDLAAHCAQYPLPIIAGIGHQRDVSVVDIVAHLSVKTPTAAAEWLIDRMTQQWTILEDYKRRLLQTKDKRLLIAQHKLQRVQMRLSTALQQYLSTQRYHLQLAEKTIVLRSPEKIYKMGYSLTRANGKLLRSVADAPAGTRIETELLDGKITAIVE